MTVELFKKDVKYLNDKKEEKIGTRFYLKCNNDLIPIEVTYFGKDDKKDNQYVPRKAILSAFAEVLPDKPEVKETK